MSQYQQTEPTIVSRLSDALKAVRSTLGSALSAASIADPLEVIIGYPTWTEATKVWAQPIDPGYVTVDALPDVRYVTRYAPEWGQVGPIVVAFSATFTTSQITVSSVSAPTPAGTNFHCFFSNGGPIYDAQYTSVSNDTPATVATALAAKIDALAVPGVSASAASNVTTIAGAAFTAVNVGGFAGAHKEVARVARTLQVSIWVSSPWVRFQVQDAITTQLGAIDNCWLTLPDGGRVLIIPKGEAFDDDSQESTNVYIAHLLYHFEYGVVQRATATQIGAISLQEILYNEAGQQTREQTLLIS